MQGLQLALEGNVIGHELFHINTLPHPDLCHQFSREWEEGGGKFHSL